MRGGSILTGWTVDSVGYLVANFAFLGALLVLYRLISLDYGDSATGAAGDLGAGPLPDGALLLRRLHGVALPVPLGGRALSLAARPDLVRRIGRCRGGAEPLRRRLPHPAFPGAALGPPSPRLARLLAGHHPGLPARPRSGPLRRAAQPRAGELERLHRRAGAVEPLLGRAMGDAALRGLDLLHAGRRAGRHLLDMAANLCSAIRPGTPSPARAGAPTWPTATSWSWW